MQSIAMSVFISVLTDNSRGFAERLVNGVNAVTDVNAAVGSLAGGRGLRALGTEFRAVDGQQRSKLLGCGHTSGHAQFVNGHRTAPLHRNAVVALGANERRGPTGPTRDVATLGRVGDGLVLGVMPAGTEVVLDVTHGERLRFLLAMVFVFHGRKLCYGLGNLPTTKPERFLVCVPVFSS